jgi:hypothetical protein
MTENLFVKDDWVASCTLPTVEQPLRLAEFDGLFVEGVTGVDQISPLHLRLQLRADPAVVARAASLAVKETACCSFFAFDLSITQSSAAMTISTEPTHQTMLNALGARARSKLGADA